MRRSVPLIVAVATLAVAAQPAPAAPGGTGGSAAAVRERAVVLGITDAGRTLRLVHRGRVVRYAIAGTLPRLGAGARVSFTLRRGVASSVRRLGLARRFAVVGRIVRTRGGLGLRLADGALFGDRRRTRGTRHAASGESTITVRNVTVRITGFDIGQQVRVLVEFPPGGGTMVTVSLLRPEAPGWTRVEAGGSGAVAFALTGDVERVETQPSEDVDEDGPELWLDGDYADVSGFKPADDADEDEGFWGYLPASLLGRAAATRIGDRVHVAGHYQHVEDPESPLYVFSDDDDDVRVIDTIVARP